MQIKIRQTREERGRLGCFGGSTAGRSGRGGRCRAAQTLLVLTCVVPGVLKADSIGPTINVWYGDNQSFGLIGTPQKWVNVLGNVSDVDGVSSLDFRLNGGSPSPLSVGPDTNRLVSPGDFNVEIPITSMQEGTNEILITATDGQNNVSTKTVTVNYSSANSWPMPYSVDWESVTDIQDVVQVVDGLWTIQGDTIRPAIIGYDRILAVGQMTWTDYQVTVPMTIHSHTNGYGGSGFGIIIRWKGHTDWGGRQPTIGWNPIGASGWYDFGYQGGTLVLSGDNSGKLDQDDTGRHLQFGVPYIWKMRVLTLPGVGNEYKLKVWEASEPEPSTWDLEGIGGFNDLASGSCLLIAHNADISFGDVAITPTGDVDPPIITSIQAAPGTTSATITWTTDEPATGSVAFGPTQAYENGIVNHGTLLTNHSLVLTNLLPGTTYHYQVSSVDGNGNPASSTDLTFATAADATAPVISNVQVATGPTSATITWTTDEPATSRVAYGPTVAYEDGTVEDLTLVTQHTIQLTGLATNQTYHYEITSVDGSNNPTSTADATFVPVGDTTPPVISNIQAAAGTTSATITWTTDEPASGSVAYGPTQAYENGSVSHGTLLTSHSLLLTGLQPDTAYHFQVTSADGSGNLASAPDQLFTTSSQQGPGAIVSDDFNATTLNGSLWTFVNPLGDASLTMNGLHAVISVPAGVDHDIWSTGTFAPRLMQPIADDDFEAEVRFETLLNQRYQMAGVLVEQDAQNFLRIEFLSTGGSTLLFAASFANSSPSVRINRSISAGNPLHMRVRRESSTWTVFYSYDGTAWTNGGSFQRDLTVSAVGPYIANAEPSPGGAPAHVGAIDYFFNTASPIVPEDGDQCLSDPDKTDPGVCGCGVPDTDSDSDGTPDCNDQCPNDPGKTEPGFCGCGVADVDANGDGTPDCIDDCPDDPDKTEPGVCGCGVPDIDSDSDGTLDCNDECPNDPNKIAAGVCGCGVADVDSDSDGTPDCDDQCPTDPDKTEPGACGCGEPDTDTNGDGVPDCNDQCPDDPDKITPGLCGCGVPDVDSDSDGTPDCNDQCPNDPAKIEPGVCGCGVADTDSDSDGTPDCNDACPADPNKTAAGTCGCGVADVDSDSDGTLDCNDQCPSDPDKIEPGVCGCGVADTDTDSDGTPDCLDQCPTNPDKTEPDACGCGIADEVAPVLSDIQVTAGPTSATIAWTTDEPATSSVSYGPTAAYEDGTVEDLTLVTQHSIDLTGLASNQTYHYQIASFDCGGNFAGTTDATFTTGSQQEPGAIVSDDFSSGVLDESLWTFVNPLGDATLTMDGTHAVIQVPAGVDHDIWSTGAFAPRLMQSIADDDFEAEVRFDASLTLGYQMTGVFVEQDAQNFARVEFHTNGLGTKLFVATFRNNSPSIRIYRAIASGNPLYLRVGRVGDAWTVFYSYDGTTWTDGGSFQHSMAVSAIGPYIANAEPSPGAAPAFTGAIDYFFNTASPIVPEDGGQ